MKIKMLTIAATFSLSLLASEELIKEYSFEEGTLPEGWSLSADGFLISPEHPNSAIRLEVALVEKAQGGEFEIWDFVSKKKLAYLTGETQFAKIEFASTADFRKFELRKNNVDVKKFSVAWLDPVIPMPANFRVDEWYQDSVMLKWDAVADAALYRVAAWTNAVIGTSNGNETWIETFANMPAGGTQQMKATALANADHGEAWAQQSFTGLYYIDVGKGIRLGKADGAGAITVPHILENGENFIRVKAYQYSKSNGQKLCISYVTLDGVTTNAVTELALSADIAEYTVQIPSEAVGKKILLSSVSSKKEYRIGITGISIGTGFSKGHVERIDIASIETTETKAVIGKLPLSEVSVSIQAFPSNENNSPSPISEISVCLADAPKKILLASNLKSGYSENFNSLSSADEVWEDGKTLPYFLAALNGGAVEKIASSTGIAGKTGGLHAFAADKSNVESFSLAAVANTKNDMAFGLCVSNDTAEIIKDIALSYDAKQWTFDSERKEAQSLRLFYKKDVSSLIDALEGATEVDAVAFSAISLDAFKAGGEGIDSSSYTRKTTLTLDDIVLKPGEKVVIYWKMDKVSNADALGIDNVSISCATEPMAGFAIRIASVKQSE
jgi:hypothetical protein